MHSVATMPSQGTVAPVSTIDQSLKLRRIAAEKTALMNGDEIARALEKLAADVARMRRQSIPLALIGIRTRGVPLAARLAQRLTESHEISPPVGAVDITLYRDDLSQIAHTPV